MNKITRPAAAVMLLLLFTLLTTAQPKRQTTAKPPAKAPAVAPTPTPTFDTLLPTDAYVIYGEVRGAGQLIRSSAVSELLEPVLKLAGPPREFKSIVKWLNTHSEELMTSRLLVATWPTNSNVPDVLIAIEFASAEEATKFSNPLNEFMSTILPPPSESSSKTDNSAAPAKPKPTPPPGPSFHLQRLGSLVVLSPRPWTMKQLRPAGSKLLSEDVNFRAARNRFNAEPIFVYFDMKAMEQDRKKSREYWEERQREETERAKREGEKAATEKVEPEKKAEPAEAEEEIPEPESGSEFRVTEEPPKEAPTPDPMNAALTTLGLALFGGEADTPEGIGFALSFEGDSFDLRALLVNAPGEKSDVLPFWPRIIPGAAIAPESPNILPAGTELLAVMSLDLPQIYAAMAKPQPPSEYTTSRGNNVPVNKVEFESPFAVLESRLQLSVKDDLLPLLGSEIALALPMHNMNILGLPKPPDPKPEVKEPSKETENQAPAVEAAPILAIAVKDREQLRALLPKVIDTLGFKGASAFAQTEKREDTELVSFANFFAYAFVGNFLVISPDAATTRRVVDSYLKHETLASDAYYKSYTRWQPRQLQGQIYISQSLMEGYKVWASDPSTMLSEQSRAFLTRFSLMAQPVTYSLSNEGFGPLHEAHLPKSLVMLAVAGISGEMNPAPTVRNERMAIGLMYQIAAAQDTYQKSKGSGTGGTLDQLIEADLVSKELLDQSGYRFMVTVSADKFEISAIPVEYGKTGTMSLFTDQTRVLRGGDRGGAAATVSDPPIH